MSASFPPMMFSFEELVNIVKLIVDMENAVSQHLQENLNPNPNPTPKNKNNYKKEKLKQRQKQKFKQSQLFYSQHQQMKMQEQEQKEESKHDQDQDHHQDEKDLLNNSHQVHNNLNHKNHHSISLPVPKAVAKKNGFNAPKKSFSTALTKQHIQRWISRRNKRDLLFMLASISGQQMRIYTQDKKQGVKQMNCRVTMDGNYLMMGSSMLHLNPSLEISLGIDVCYPEVRHILTSLGIRISHHKKNRLPAGGDLSVNFGTKYKPAQAHNESHGEPSAKELQRLRAEQLAFVHQHNQQFVIDSDIKCDELDEAKLKQKYGTLAYDQYRHYQQLTRKKEDYVLSYNRYKYAGKSYHIRSRSISSKYCITIYDPQQQQTMILQLDNMNKRRMWARGLCYLKNLNTKARNFRWMVVAYLMTKYASTLLARTKQNVSKKGKKGHYAYGVPCYFEPFRQIYNILNVKDSAAMHRKFPRKYKEMFTRRQKRSSYQSVDKFVRNEILYDPNKIVPLPEDEEKFYE